MKKQTTTTTTKKEKKKTRRIKFQQSLGSNLGFATSRERFCHLRKPQSHRMSHRNVTLQCHTTMSHRNDNLSALNVKSFSIKVESY